MTAPVLQIPVRETERLVLRGPADEAFMRSSLAHPGDRGPRKVWQIFAAEVVGWGHRVTERRDGVAAGVTGFARPATEPGARRDSRCRRAMSEPRSAPRRGCLMYPRSAFHKPAQGHAPAARCFPIGNNNAIFVPGFST